MIIGKIKVAINNTLVRQRTKVENHWSILLTRLHHHHRFNSCSHYYYYYYVVRRTKTPA